MQLCDMPINEYNQITMINNFVVMGPIHNKSTLVQVIAPHNLTKEMELQHQSTNVRFYFMYQSECIEISFILMCSIPLRSYRFSWSTSDDISIEFRIWYK